MGDLVIISKHEKGFWQADMYRDATKFSPSEFEALGLSPDSFFTMKNGETVVAAAHKAAEKWPGARIDLVETVDSDDDDEQS